MSKQLSIKDSILFAVNGLVSHPWYFVKMFLYWLAYLSLLAVALLLLIIGLGFLLHPLTIQTIAHATSVTINSWPFSILLCITGVSVIYFWVSAVFVPIALLLSFDPKSPKPFTFGSFFTALDFKTAFRLFSAGIIYLMLVTIGFICLIIPGVYFFIKFSWVSYYIIDEKTGVMEGLEKSYARTTGHFWQLLGLYILAGILSSTLILIPVVCLMLIRAYKRGN